MMNYKLIIVFVLSSGFSFAQKKEDKKWDVSNPPGKYTEVEFIVNEGTWMNLDVSPDAREIVFDLLGDIYSMPISGGEAKLLRGGLAFEVQPRYSPDGSKISFTSDAGGGDNIWYMNRDGSGAKQVTKEEFRLLNNAVWNKDGNYLIARKHFTSARSLGAGELWMYHFIGGEGLQLTSKKNEQQDLGEPCISPDGKYVYYSEDVYPGGYFQYNKDPNDQIYAIKRYGFEKGEIEFITGGGGSAMRPQVSKDGKLLAFVKRVREKTVLYIRNIESGEEWPVYDQLSKDQQQAWAIFGVYPNFSWIDEKNIVIWAMGKIWKLDIISSLATEIPFTLKSKHRITDALKFPQEIDQEKFTVKAVRQVSTSPDEKMIIFNSAGYLWKKDLPNGVPERLSKTNDFEFESSFSPSGTDIAFVTWNDQDMGAIWKMNLKDKKLFKLSTEKGIYRSPKYSPDGKTIVFRKEEGNDHQGFSFCTNPGIYCIPSLGGKPILIIKEGDDPQFNIDGKRIFFRSGEGEKHVLKSCDLNGKDVRTHFSSKYTNSFELSPDNKWIAYSELFKVYLAAIPEYGKSIDLVANTNVLPSTQIARDAGINIHWSADGTKIHWTLGDEYFTNVIKNRFTFLPGSPDSIAPMDTVGVKINLVIDSDKPKGLLAFTGAQIITMKGDEIIENGTILISGNHIVGIGKNDQVIIPEGVKIIDVKGKTIMPGLVDVHSHLGSGTTISTQKIWSYYANLAYGVTTTHDPSANTELVFSLSEMVKAGNMVGPRIFSTGTILYGAEGDFKAVINSLEDAKSAIRRTKAFGAFSVKSYNQPRRNQRQQVIEAARDLGVMVVPEGGSTTFHNLTQILDGHTGIEHNLPVAPLYNDVVQLWGKSRTGYTPTLIVCYGTMFGENYWYQKTNVWEKQRLLTFTPRSIIDQRSRHRMMTPDLEYENGHILVSKSCKKLADAGVKVNLGSHGQLQGLGAHWELWMLSQGGMSNMEVLRSATMNGASYIGMDKYIGSLETGKLADLIIMDKSPLVDIHNTESIRYTMINGRLYDCDSMNEIGNFDHKRTKFFWEGKYDATFPWHENTVGNED